MCQTQTSNMPFHLSPGVSIWPAVDNISVCELWADKIVVLNCLVRLGEPWISHIIFMFCATRSVQNVKITWEISGSRLLMFSIHVNAKIVHIFARFIEGTWFLSMWQCWPFVAMVTWQSVMHNTRDEKMQNDSIFLVFLNWHLMATPTPTTTTMTTTTTRRMMTTTCGITFIWCIENCIFRNAKKHETHFVWLGHIFLNS